MKFTFLAFCILLINLSLFGQIQNIELVSNVEIDENATDIWGFVDKNNTEYAIIATINSVRIFSLEDPTSPIQRAAIDGVSSQWRDIKSMGDYLYIAADQGKKGIQIIDMSGAPNSITSSYFRPELIIDNTVDTINTCHNLYIDDEGYIYLSGCNISKGGIIIYNANDQPTSPSFVGIENLEYSHDVYVQNQIMYTSEIYRGWVGIYDIQDRTNPVLLATQNTTSSFTHNAWSSTDGNYVFTTDERANSFVDAYDISDYDQIKRIDQYRPKEGELRGTIPHNTHYLDGYLYTSWYTDGLVIMDANRPQNMIPVAQYDTWEGADGGYNGNWGAYPFLPSGLILVSDRVSGLFVLRPELKRAAYLEGNITDCRTNEAVNGVDVSILSTDPNYEVSDPTGFYKTGIASSGEFEVVFSHPEYQIDTVLVTLKNGELTEFDISLKKNNISISCKVLLEGPYQKETGLMRSTLNGLGYLPGQKPIAQLSKETPVGQPYGSIVWDYMGTEGEPFDYNKTSENGGYPSDAIDWVLLSLRSDTDNSTTVCRRAALVLENGDVQLVENFDCCDIDENQAYYLVVEHRNHLVVMSPEAILATDGVLTWDFTAQDSYLKIAGKGQKNIDGKYVMLAGNGNQMGGDGSSDTDINTNDLNDWRAENGINSGYFINDLDLSGDVNVADKAIWLSNNGVFSAVPRN